MKKYNEKRNVTGKLIANYRIKNNLSKTELCEMLQLHAIYIDITELKRIEDGEMILKDFEFLGFCKVLDIDYNELKNLID